MAQRNCVLDDDRGSDLDPSFYGSFCEQLEDHKTAARNQHARHVGKRRNKREERRQRLRQLLQKRSVDHTEFCGDVQPHADDESSQFADANSTISEDASVFPELDHIIQERNKLAHAAVASKPIDKEDSEFSNLLMSVGSAKIYAEGFEYSNEIDEWLGHLENMVILGYQIGKSESFLDIFMAVAGFAKMYSKQKSIVMELYRIINEVSVTCDSADTSPHALKDWSGRMVMEKWDLFKTHVMFKKISYLISAAMSLTVCTTKNVEWSVFGLQLVSFEAAKEQLKAVDVIDALIKTFVWMCEVGWRCFETRSIAPILYSDVKIQQYNTDCDWVIAKADAACAGNIEDLGEYENKLNAVLKQTCTMKAAKADGPTALWLQKRYVDLMSITEKLVAKRRNTDIRVQPFGWSLHGATSVGKTTLGKLTMHQSLAAMGFCSAEGEVDDARILTMDMFDKYQSTWTSDILGVFMDDIGNAKAEFSKENPHTSVIIKFFNNVAAQAIKAELNAKGVVFIDFKVGVVTTNVKDLDARCYSNCPESILRRFFHVEVNVKEEYRKQGTIMLNKAHPDIRDSNTLVQDVWDLTIEEVNTFETKAGKTSYRFDILNVTMDDGRVIRCEKLGLREYLQVVIQLSKNHKAEQDSLLMKAKNQAKAKFCLLCKQYPEYCECIKCVEPAGMEMIASVVHEASKLAITNYIKSWTRPVDLINSVLGFSPLRNMATASIARELQTELNEKGTPLLVAITPEWLFRTTTFQNSVKAFHNATAYYDLRRPFGLLGVACLSLCGYGTVKRNRSMLCTGLLATWASTVLGFAVHQRRVRQLESEYLQKRDALPTYAKTVRDGKFPKGVLFVATLALGVKMISMWNDNRVKALPQSMTPEDIDKQPSWFGYMMEKIGWKATSSVNGSPPQHILDTTAKNLWWAHFKRSDGSETGCNIVCPEKGIVWFPRHIFYPGSDMTKERVKWLDVTCHRVGEDEAKRNCSKVSFKAEWNVNTVTLDSLDLVATFVPNCPDISNNLMKHLPLSAPSGNSSCTILVRDKDARLTSEAVAVSHGKYGHKYLSMEGGSYRTSKATSGSCMALLVPEGKNSLIAGFHIGGNTQKQYGVMMTVLKRQAEELKSKLYTLPGIKGLANSTDLPHDQYGVPILASSEVHPNATFIRDLTPDARVDIFGSTKQRSQMKSSVVKSVLSDKIAEHFHVENKWGAPKLLPNWKAYNATLEHIVNPSDMFLPSLLERARVDWITPVKEFAQKIHLEQNVVPLTDREMVLGVDGKRFLDAVPMKTGMGFPIFGPKHKWFEEIREGEKLIDRIPHEAVKAEMSRLFTCWSSGQRGYPITTATLKDEPTPLNKEKVRVFQAVAVAFGLYIRKYFLPIARVLSLCPELSEAAVGVNAFGPQWDSLMKHAEKYAEGDRVIAWDYSKYDVRMNSQMTYAVLQSFIEIAQVCGYTKEDLYIMNMMIADMIHPLIDYNGTLLMAYNMNTSGNNITVNINSVAGSLYVRMGFFHAYPEETDFRDCVAAMTYGDDFKGSVKPEYRDKFNFFTFRDFLAKHKMKVTLPDKSDNASADLHVDDADFLKRHSNFIPEIGMRIGKLSEDSIFKSLHCNLKSKSESPRTVAISCIETAMHEWFAHGRDVYNDRQGKMKKVCRDVGLAVPSVDYSFDSRVDMWKEKYGRGSFESHMPVIDFDFLCDDEE